MKHLTKIAATALPIALVASVAQAHTGAAPGGGFVAGLTHPFFGADHLLAMVAVGLWAALLGGRATWLVPATFVGVMAAGGLLAVMAVGMPAVEIIILASVVALGCLVAARIKASLMIAMAVVGAFALFHGHAHGTEMPAGASGLLYSAGFILATAALHALGISFALLTGRIRDGLAIRAAGGAVAAAGVLLLAGI